RIQAPTPVFDKLVAFVLWSVIEMANVLAPVFVPVRVSVLVPAVSNRFIFAPVCVKLNVADGLLPAASIVPPVGPLRTRISRLVDCGTDRVYWSVPPWKCRLTPVTVVFSWLASRAPIALVKP